MKALIDPGFWSDPDFDVFAEPTPLLVYLYLATNSDVTCTGAYRLSLRKATHELRLTEEQIMAAVKALNGRVMFDKATGWVWVRGYLSRMIVSVKNPNMKKGVERCLGTLLASDFPFSNQFRDKYNQLLTDFKLIPNNVEKEKKGEVEKKVEKESPPAAVPAASTKPPQRHKKAGIVPEYTPDFERFWSAYPRHDGKKPAFDSFTACIAAGIKIEEMIAGAQRYHTTCAVRGTPIDKTAHASTWLNNARWQDEGHRQTPPTASPDGQTFLFKNQRPTPPVQTEEPK